MLNKVLKSAEIDEIIDYIGDNFKAVPYLYVNVLKYGSGTDSVTTWIDRNENGNMEGVYLLYYDCIHFYTNNMDIYPAKQLTGLSCFRVELGIA